MTVRQNRQDHPAQRTRDCRWADVTNLAIEAVAPREIGIYRLFGQNWAMDNGADRPWGRYEVLSDAPDHKVKRIIVEPGRRLSYQTHEQRSEHWFVVGGEGEVTLDGLAIPVHPGIAVDIPLRTPHRVENTGSAPLVFIEVQHGDYFGEDDITRLDDDFGRAGCT